MEAERLYTKQPSRTIQQKRGGQGALEMVDNRPAGILQAMSELPLQCGGGEQANEENYYKNILMYFLSGISREKENQLKPLNVGEIEIETITRKDGKKVPCVRLYRVNYAPSSLIPFDTEEVIGDAISTTGYNEVQQDKMGRIIISSGRKDAKTADTTVYMSVGRPYRALKWLYKYDAQGKGAANPVVRSFLVPLNTMCQILSNTLIQGETSITCKDDYSENSDFAAAPNQFGFRPKYLKLLRDNAIPGSLISYFLYPKAFNSFQDGKIKPISELIIKAGLEYDSRISMEVLIQTWLEGSKFARGNSDGILADLMTGPCMTMNLLMNYLEHDEMLKLLLNDPQIRKDISTFSLFIDYIYPEFSPLSSMDIHNIGHEQIIEILKYDIMKALVKVICSLVSLAKCNSLIYEDFIGTK